MTAMATATRTVMRESAKCRSGRAMDRTVLGRFSDPGGRGGKSSRLFGNEKRVACQADGDVVIPAAVGAALEVIEPELAFEVFVRSFDPPAFLQGADDLLARPSARERCKSVLRWKVRVERPLDDEPLLGSRTARTGHRLDAQDGVASAHRFLGSFAPRYLADVGGLDLEGDILDGHAFADRAPCPRPEQASNAGVLLDG